jgi:succinyl-diaminopimelate desuccinylase
MIDAVALTQTLVRFDTRNPPGDEAACVRHLANLLESHGFAVTLSDFGLNRLNLVARRGDGPAPTFTGHLDVVPLGSAPWTRDPFGGEIIDGKLYGRGSCDMKAGVAAMIAAAIAEPDAPVTLILTGGEETGSNGARALAESAPSGCVPARTAPPPMAAPRTSATTPSTRRPAPSPRSKSLASTTRRTPSWARRR